MICRLWQFLIGSLTFYISGNENTITYTIIQNEEEEKVSSNAAKPTFKLELITLLPIILICFCPVKVAGLWKSTILKISATCLTGYLIFKEDMFERCKDTIIDRIMVYIGNASYSIYLLHWPVIVFSRYFGYNMLSYGIYY